MSHSDLPPHTISPASADDFSFIRDTILRLNLDAENLKPQQFIVVRREGRTIAFGRIKPYRRTHELGAVAVMEKERGKGWGRLVVQELIRRFPQDEVYVTTDLPQYFEKLGFLATETLPPELEAKLARVEGKLRSGVVGMIYDRCYDRLPTLADVYRAKHAIEPHLPRTPLLPNLHLSRLLEADVYLKHDNLLPIGAFKVRGGINLVCCLSPQERSRGVIAASTGNHGQSIAYAARCFGVPCTIAMPRRSNPLKVEAIRALGAQVAFHGRHFEEARAWAERYAVREGLRYIHHINEPLLIAGVATMSLEIVEDLPDVEVIVTPVGAGSGAVGHCLVAKALRPQVRVYGVQAEGAPAVYRSWKQGRLVRAAIATFAEGLATGIAFYTPVRVFRERLDDMVLVSEEEMRQAIILLLRSAHQLAEGAGAAATAGALKLRDQLKGKKVTIILSGGNLTIEGLRQVLRPTRRRSPSP